MGMRARVGIWEVNSSWRGLRQFGSLTVSADIEWYICRSNTQRARVDPQRICNAALAMESAASGRMLRIELQYWPGGRDSMPGPTVATGGSRLTHIPAEYWVWPAWFWSDEQTFPFWATLNPVAGISRVVWQTCESAAQSRVGSLCKLKSILVPLLLTGLCLLLFKTLGLQQLRSRGPIKPLSLTRVQNWQLGYRWTMWTWWFNAAKTWGIHLSCRKVEFPRGRVLVVGAE